MLERLSRVGVAAQTSVPGTYAWALTVAPVATVRGAGVVAKVAAIVALAALWCAIPGEARWGSRARFGSLWAFVVASGAAWSMAPGALAPLRVDAVRGVAGMLGWALFAFVSAAPALESRGASTQGKPFSPHGRRTVSDSALVTAGVFSAALTQIVGWRIANVERSLLVRFVALAVGLLMIGASADIALARRRPSSTLPPRARLRRAMAPLVILGLLALAGVLFSVRG